MKVKCVLSVAEPKIEIVDGSDGDVAILLGNFKAYLTPTDAIRFGLDLIAFANQQVIAVPEPMQTIAASLES